ncbi:carboxypeptidase-like regulatory domain-containing protein [Moheibacter lacus]|uniref:Carboxypeptidase-like regulatory domain-containing protein n=1 Tax=Moheibacter lacus TaxID=2745851 RepID=A0A838ZMG6_9FLAO|nr:carboxypeptidase-like regulatory domain-containing protein [Moheibacter lacus]MBA5629724.1 carboxypeptidase-like regulatory domain-containing protein [Moheibacter lacus]
MRIFIIIFLFLAVLGKAQIQINGKVVDEFGFVVSDVLVYVDGSSISTHSDIEGQFSLQLSNGNYQIVFRKEGYENQIKQVNANVDFFEIQLQTSKAIELDEAHIVKLSEEKWREYYELFKLLFLGQNNAAQLCEITNPKVLNFSYDEENATLKASARQPLKIQNQYLGYELEYDLVDFSMDYRNQIQYIAGTSLFVEMQGSKSKNKKWNRNRLSSFHGSLMHFVRSLYDEKLKENGFIINRLIRKENPDFKIYRERIQKMADRGEVIHVKNPPSQIIQTLVKADVPYDSLRIRSDNTVVLNFEGLYHVEFTGEKEDMDYVRTTTGDQFIGNQYSIIYLLENKWVEIEANGNYFPPKELMTEGYFTWEKIGNLLPLDFKP